MDFKVGDVNMIGEQLGLFLAFIFALSAVTEFFGGNAFWAFSAWVACVLTLSFILKLVDKKLNEKLKLSLSLVLLVLFAVGIPVNAYVFSMSTGWLTRILSLSMLTLIVVLIVVPMLLGLITYSIGKRSLSKKIIKWLIGVSY